MGFYLQTHGYPNTKLILVFALFTIFEYSFFCYFFYLIIPKSTAKKIVPFVWLGFVLFAITNIFYFNKMNSFDSFAIGMESIIILLLCIYYLYLQIKDANNLMIYSTFNFWIIITFLIYFSGTFFLYIMAENMLSNIAFQKQYLIINSIFSILKNILLSIAMTMKTNYTIKQTPPLRELDGDVYFHKNN